MTWVKNGCTTNGSKISADGSTGRFLIYQQFNVRMGEFITASCDFRASEIRRCYLRFGNTSISPSPWAVFDCLSGVIVAKSSDCFATIKPLTDGWFRVSIRGTVPFVNTGPKNFEIGLLSTNDTSPTIDTTIPNGHGLFAKRPQAEIGKNETSYQQVTNGIREFGIRLTQKINDDFAPRAAIMPLGRPRKNKINWSSDITKPNWRKGSGSFTFDGTWSEFTVTGTRVPPEGFGVPIISSTRSISFYVKKTSDALRFSLRDEFSSGNEYCTFTFDPLNGTLSEVANPLGENDVSVLDVNTTEWRVLISGVELPPGSRKYLRIESDLSRGSGDAEIHVRGFQGEVGISPSDLQEIRSGAEYSALTRRNLISETTFSHNIPAVGSTNGALMFYGITKSDSQTSVEFIGKGIDGEREYADVRFYGTSGSNGKNIAKWLLSNSIDASEGITYSYGLDIAMIYGEGMRNALLGVEYLNSSSVVMGSEEIYVSVSSLTRDVTRFTGTSENPAPAGTAKIRLFLAFETLQGNFDFIIRSQAPQVEIDLASTPYQKIINEFHITEEGTESGWALIFDGIDDNLSTDVFDPGLKAYTQMYSLACQFPDNLGIEDSLNGVQTIGSLSLPVDAENKLKSDQFLITTSPTVMTLRNSNSSIESGLTQTPYDAPYAAPIRIGGDGGDVLPSFRGVLGPVIFRFSSSEISNSDIETIFNTVNTENKVI